MIYVEEKYSVELCREQGWKLFVFGDNLARYGKGGQAVIRSEVNAIGIPTKRLPAMNNESFFNDKQDEFEAVEHWISLIAKLSETKDIVFPKGGLGTGLANMQECSPKLFNHMNTLLLLHFGFDNLTGTLQNTLLI